MRALQQPLVEEIGPTYEAPGGFPNLRERVLLDTGPLVSFLVGTAEHHQWACDHWKRFKPPLYTCESVLAETAHLLRREHYEPEPLLELLELGMLEVTFFIKDDLPALKQLLRRYSNLRMSLADACLVRMSEIAGRCVIMTLDSDFQVYRRFGRQHIPVLMPLK